MIDVYMERFEHPYLFALIPIGGILLALSATASVMLSDTWAGFLALYAMVMLILCVIGYGGIITIAYGTEFLRQWRIHRSDFD